MFQYAQNWGTGFWNFDFKIFGEFLKFYIQTESMQQQQHCYLGQEASLVCFLSIAYKYTSCIMSLCLRLCVRQYFSVCWTVCVSDVHRRQNWLLTVVQTGSDTELCEQRIPKTARLLWNLNLAHIAPMSAGQLEVRHWPWHYWEHS